MNKLKKLIGKNALAAAAVGMVGVSTALGAYVSGGSDQTSATGFSAGYDVGSSYCYVRFYWDPANGSTEDQFKRVYKYRSSTQQHQSLYYGDGYDLMFEGYFNSSVDYFGNMECFLELPNWGYQWYHSWSWIST